MFHGADGETRLAEAVAVYGVPEPRVPPCQNRRNVPAFLAHKCGVQSGGGPKRTRCRSGGDPLIRGRRIAITVPPGEWFHGIARRMFEIYRAELANLGFVLFDVPVEVFLSQDATAIGALLAELKAFGPEWAFGLHKGAYALLCQLPPGKNGLRPNVFLDVLEIPTICLWDHAPFELANVLLRDDPAAMDARGEPAMETLRRVLTHPRLLHWSPDTGQTRLMEELGFVLPGQVIQESLPSLPEFHAVADRCGTNGSDAKTVGFVGHFYQGGGGYLSEELEVLAREVVASWLAAFEQSPWRVLCGRLAEMDGTTRERMGLTPERAGYWRFTHRLVLHDAQTALRLKVLGGVGTEVICHGNLDADLQDVPPNLVAVHGHIPFGPELAGALRRHAVGIDVFNPGAVDGYSHKPMLAFAAGGFLLVNRKRDFLAAFGDAGEAVSYGTDVAVKVDRYLTNGKLRAEVGAEIRETIRARFQLRDVLRRVMEAASARAAQG